MSDKIVGGVVSERQEDRVLLSDRIRQNAEAAPWVIDAVKELERENTRFRLGYQGVLDANEKLKNELAGLRADLSLPIRILVNENAILRAVAARYEAHGVNEALLAAARFGLCVLRESRRELADLDGGWIQDEAERLGLLTRKTVTEPCGECCRCDDFPAECLDYSPVALAAKDAAREKA